MMPGGVEKGAVALLDEGDVPFSWQYFGMCVFVGFLSAVSLPLGSILGLQWQPNSTITGVMEAFGGGALLAALAVTMVAPISLGAADHTLNTAEQQEYKELLAVLIVSAMVGGVFFILLDQLITRKGGELRKLYGQARYYGVTPGTKALVESKKVRTLQSSSMFGVLSAPRQVELAHLLKPLVFHENDVLYGKGDVMDRLMFIRKGTVELQNEPGQPFWVAGAGDVLGTTGILTGAPQPQTAIAVSDVECLFVPRSWVERIMEEEPQLKYLLLKSSYAKMCVAMEMDRKLFDSRNETREKLCERFSQYIRETKRDLQNAGTSISKLSLEFTSQNMLQLSNVTPNQPSMDIEVARQSFISPEPSFIGQLSGARRQRSLLEDVVDLDDIVGLVKEGELAQVSPEDIIDQQVKSILTGRRESQPTSGITTPCRASQLARPSLEPAPPVIMPPSPQGEEPFMMEDEGSMRSMPEGANRFSLKKALSVVSMAGIDTDTLTAPAEVEWRASGTTTGTAPLAVFLGIMLDGIPESIVIGVHTQETIRELLAYGERFGLNAIIPYTLIAGLFLSNFPEALASSMQMYKYGWSKLRILSMWSSIMLMTAAGAGIGFALANVLSKAVLIGVQGFAAGAMLTMIASSMIPEAVHLCGPSWTGISVLLGFMATNLFQMI